MKVTVIEEVNDVTQMKLDKLFGSLKTFELTLGGGDPKKKSSIAFSSINEDNTQP